MNLLSAQYLVHCLDTENVCHHITTMDHPQMEMKKTLEWIPQDVPHLLNCTAHPNDLSPVNLWGLVSQGNAVTGLSGTRITWINRCFFVDGGGGIISDGTHLAWKWEDSLIPSGVIRWLIKATYDTPNTHLSWRKTSPLDRNKDNNELRFFFASPEKWSKCRYEVFIQQ